MSYEPKVWQCGDTITADDLNHIEEGIANCGGGGTLVVKHQATQETEGRTYLDATWQEVFDALANAQQVILNEVFVEDEDASNIPLLSAHHDPVAGYIVDSSFFVQDFTLTADSADGYLYMTA